MSNAKQTHNDMTLFNCNTLRSFTSDELISYTEDAILRLRLLTDEELGSQRESNMQLNVERMKKVLNERGIKHIN